MTLYPNIIYHRDSGTEIFIDTLQGIGNPRNADMVEYTSAVDGKPYSFTRDPGQRALTLNGKISTDNENTLRRQLDYLIGEQVYLMLGAEELATLAKIRSYSFQKAVGTYTPLSLDVICDGTSEGQFHEAEDTTTDGTLTPLTTASGGVHVVMGEYSDMYFNLTQSTILLPEGEYTMFVRACDANQVTDDFVMRVRNMTDSTNLLDVTKTLASAHAIYTGNFTVDSNDVGDLIQFYVYKDTATTNTIYVDYLGFVRRE
jgi:hypothetical protein